MHFSSFLTENENYEIVFNILIRIEFGHVLQIFVIFTFSIGLERLEVGFLEFSHPPGPLPDESVSVHLLTYGELEFIGQFVHKVEDIVI